MPDWIVPAAAGVLALVALALGVTLARGRARTERDLAQARAETAELREQLDALERRLQPPPTEQRPVAAEFVITDLGQEQAADEQPVAPAHIDTALFADLVLRETVVKAASLAHGVRRALAAETRNRIRFEMKREVRRARKQRKSDTREARREWEARQRASLDDTDEDSAA